jgi:ribonuclease HII
VKGLRAYHTKGKVEAGCDEAGRGCLAGPVFAAAVILPPNYKNEELNDSKKLSEAKRKALKEVVERDALAFAVASLNNVEIDLHNILWSSFLAMHRALDQLNLRPNSLLIDGNRFIPYHDIQHHCIVKGDGKYLSIAAASILAKTYRDEYMEALHKEFPVYGWDKNKGYPTAIHRKAILEVGSCPYHRKSFRLLPNQLIMEFDSPSSAGN